MTLEQRYLEVLAAWRFRYDVLIGVFRADYVAMTMQHDAREVILR